MTATFPPLLQKPYSLLHVNGTIESVVKTAKPPISKVTIHLSTRLEQNWGWQRSYYNWACMIGTKTLCRCSWVIPLHQGLISYDGLLLLAQNSHGDWNARAKKSCMLGPWKHLLLIYLIFWWLCHPWLVLGSFLPLPVTLVPCLLLLPTRPLVMIYTIHSANARDFCLKTLIFNNICTDPFSLNKEIRTI